MVGGTQGDLTQRDPGGLQGGCDSWVTLYPEYKWEPLKARFHLCL